MAKFDTKPFYRSIDNDSVLQRDRAAWNLFRFLCACWVKDGCKEERQVEIGIKTIAKRLHYQDAQHITSRIIPRLVKLGYIDYTPGTGIKGQQKNVSQLSIFLLNFMPTHQLPKLVKPSSQFTEAQKINMAKATLVRAGADLESLEMLIVQGEANEAIRRAQAASRIGRASLKLFKVAGCLSRKANSLKSQA